MIKSEIMFGAKILIAIVMVLGGVILQSKNYKPSDTPSSIDQKQTESGQGVVIGAAEPTVTQTIVQDDELGSVIVNDAESYDLEESEITNLVPTNELSFLIHPEASVVEDDGHRMVLVSQRSADDITNWYKSKISSSNYSSTSFVTTKTNGIVNNVLSASDGSSQVQIEISNGNDSKNITIKISKLK